jgi:hypothetical protein
MFNLHGAYIYLYIPAQAATSSQRTCIVNSTAELHLHASLDVIDEAGLHVSCTANGY